MSEEQEQEKPTVEMIAFMDLKSKIVKLMFEFNDNYCGSKGNLHPEAAYILVDVLTSCLGEAQYQVCNYIPFTSKQVDHICYQIGEWYLNWKHEFSPPHSLGYAKEKLKEMICPERGV